MKNLVLAMLAGLLSAGLAVAQERGMNNNGQDQAQKPELMTVVGCLSQSGHTYVITGGAPGPQQFRIVGGNTALLKGKVGQTVAVAGMVGQSNPAEDAAPPYHEGSTTGVGYETIVAQRVKIMGGNCSNPGQEWKGDRIK
jgi:hypothetical protein